MRTREEQIEELARLFSWPHHPDDGHAQNAEDMILEAERRAEQRVRAEIDHKTVAAIARGYEEMFKVLSHIVGTSGADQAWYRSKAQEALSWVKPLYAISSSTNIAPPGSCQWVSREGNLEQILKGRADIHEARGKE